MKKPSGHLRRDPTVTTFQVNAIVTGQDMALLDRVARATDSTRSAVIALAVREFLAKPGLRGVLGGRDG